MFDAQWASINNAELTWKLYNQNNTIVDQGNFQNDKTTTPQLQGNYRLQITTTPNNLETQYQFGIKKV